MEKSKNILGILSVVIILILIITNSILFSLLLEERKQYEINSNSTDIGYIIKNFIIDKCRGHSVFYYAKTSYNPERLTCVIKECIKKDYCKHNIKNFNLPLVK